MTHFTLTKKAIRWLVDKVKDNTNRCDEHSARLNSIEKMIIKNQFYAPIEKDTGELIVTDDGYSILADGKYRES